MDSFLKDDLRLQNMNSRFKKKIVLLQFSYRFSIFVLLCLNNYWSILILMIWRQFISFIRNISSKKSWNILISNLCFYISGIYFIVAILFFKMYSILDKRIWIFFWNIHSDRYALVSWDRSAFYLFYFCLRCLNNYWNQRLDSIDFGYKKYIVHWLENKS